jgi:hypothetical protein
MAENDEIELTSDWYTLGIGEDGESNFKAEPPDPVRTKTKRAAADDNDPGTAQASEESVPTEQAPKTKKPKSVKKKASSPRARPLKSSKASASTSLPESSRSSTWSCPPIRPSARTRKTRQPDIIEISDSNMDADKTRSQPRNTWQSRASPAPRHSPALPRTAVTSRPSPFGEVAFSGRGWERFLSTGPIVTSSGNTLSVRATRILRALEDD